MSRLKHFSRNLTTSYLQLGVNVIYSLVSIPLILHWLPREEFGLWAVLVQLMTYMSIIDLGMTSAVARLLVDHKDERSNGNYGSLVKTAFWVSVTQGLIILMVVQLGAPLLASLMKIPAEHQHTFIMLLRVQGVITAFTFSLRPVGLMLEAHQRMDVLARGNIMGLVLQLGLLVLFLFKGCGIYSFIYANIFSAIINQCYLIWNCSRLGFLPHRREWGRASWKRFHEVFSFGRDVFLYNLGAQLISSSQTIIISRCLGLDAAAIWSVGTKMFNLCLQVLVRPLLMSMPAMSEMIVRKEMDRLEWRFKGLVTLTGSLGVFLGISYALCNSLFVGLWTHNRIVWGPLNDVLLAAWLVVLAFQSVHCNFTLVLKQIGGMRYIVFAEGCCFVLLAVLVGQHWGIAGVIACSILCTAMFSGQYSLRRSQKFFQCRFWQVAVEWVLPCLKFALVYGLLALALFWADAGLPALVRFTVNVSVAFVAGGVLFLVVGCPQRTIREILEKLPPPVSRLAGGLLVLKHPENPLNESRNKI